jgi:tetratricopeptide (TPR) repeat protein
MPAVSLSWPSAWLRVRGRRGASARALYGKNHPEYATALAWRALEITEKARGPDHPDVSIALSNLTELFRSQDRLADAEGLLQRALAIDEKAFGVTHPNVGIRLRNVAGIHLSEGRVDEVEVCYKRALDIAETAPGPDRPRPAASRIVRAPPESQINHVLRPVRRPLAAPIRVDWSD